MSKICWNLLSLSAVGSLLFFLHCENLSDLNFHGIGTSCFVLILWFVRFWVLQWQCYFAYLITSISLLHLSVDCFLTWISWSRVHLDFIEHKGYCSQLVEAFSYSVSFLIYFFKFTYSEIVNFPFAAAFYYSPVFPPSCP